MFEFNSVKLKTYTDPVSGQEVQLRLIHRTVTGTPARTVNTKGRDIDKLTKDELDTYEEMLRLVEANARKFSEKRFDIGQIAQVIIPQ